MKLLHLLFAEAPVSLYPKEFIERIAFGRSCTTWSTKITKRVPAICLRLSVLVKLVDVVLRVGRILMIEFVVLCFSITQDRVMHSAEMF